MQKLWQKKLELKLSKDVLDIVQYGSSVIEDKKPNDIDIAIFYNKISLNDQLNQSQKIKKELSKISDLKIDIKSFDFYSFLDKGNFTREPILIYGKSFFSKDYFAKNFGFTPKLHISYDLRKLEKKDKVRFHYLLKGKKNNSGLLVNYGGKIISPGLIEINPEHEEIFEKEIKKYSNIIYKKTRYLKENDK